MEGEFEHFEMIRFANLLEGTRPSSSSTILLYSAAN